MVLTLLCVERLPHSEKSEPGIDQLWGAQIGGSTVLGRVGIYDVAGLRVSLSGCKIG